MLVSVALFSIVIAGVSTAYLNLINLDRQTHALNDIVDNLNFATDSISRSIRTGTIYQCGSAQDSYGNCATTPGSSMSFVNDQGQSVSYNLSGSQINECISSTCTAFTDPRITINTLGFYVRGVGVGDNQQPQVIIVIHGSIPVSSTINQAFTIETAATERGIDI
jgi:hypothetical protein